MVLLDGLLLAVELFFCVLNLRELLQFVADVLKKTHLGGQVHTLGFMLLKFAAETAQI